MLTELHITDFAIIRRLSLNLSAGLNVLTGETGAGKSIIVDALMALLGGRVDQDLVRSGCDAARVEGVFRIAPEPEVMAFLESRSIEPEDGLLILTREISRTGRSGARINGRPVLVGMLREVGERLVDIHSQGEYLSLLRQGLHIEYLDRYAGLMQRRGELAALVGELRRVRQERASLLRDERELARRVDLLRHECQEIVSASLRPGEEEELQDELKLLSNAEERARLSYEAYSTIRGEGAGYASLLEKLETLAERLRELCRLDGRLGGEQERAAGLALELADLSASLRDYHQAVEFDPQRLGAVEERLDLIHRLKRKYGASIEEVLAFGRAAQAELEQISHAEERSAGLAEQEAEMVRRVAALAGELSEHRKAHAEGLARAIEAEMGQLDLAGHFSVEITHSASAEGIILPDQPASGPLAFDAAGVDRVEFMVSLNPGEPLRPLVKVASGGETSRLMLALKCVLHRADAIDTLVFDEVDAGLGGMTARRVGERMAYLAARRQLICITHLPQIACYGDAHVAISKREAEGATVVEAIALSEAERVEEMARLLGHRTAAARRSAEEMLRLAEKHKERLKSGQLALG